MKCKAVVRQLSVYLEDDLPASQREVIAQHLEACAACRTEAEAFSAAERALESLSATEGAPELLGELRRRFAAPPVRSARWVWAGGLVAAAAVAALLMWPRAEEKRVVPKPPRPVAPRVEVSRPAPPVVAAAPAPAKPSSVLTAKRRGRKLQACATVGMAGPSATLRVNSGTRGLQKGEAAGFPRSLGTDPALQASAAQATSGIILILGDPIPPLTESRCRLELTLADGTRSAYERNTKPGEAGQPGTVAITYEQSASDMTSNN